MGNGENHRLCQVLKIDGSVNSCARTRKVGFTNVEWGYAYFSYWLEYVGIINQIARWAQAPAPLEKNSDIWEGSAPARMAEPRRRARRSRRSRPYAVTDGLLVAIMGPCVLQKAKVHLVLSVVHLPQLFPLFLFFTYAKRPINN